jgi:hypothetical protein
LKSFFVEEAVMATKAELFKAASQRTKPRPPKVKKPLRRVDPHHTDARNDRRRSDKGVGVVLEDSMTGRPSRKSTRTSSHHGRNDTQKMRAAQQKTLTPKARAMRAQAQQKR